MRYGIDERIVMVVPVIGQAPRRYGMAIDEKDSVQRRVGWTRTRCSALGVCVLSFVTRVMMVGSDCVSERATERLPR